MKDDSSGMPPATLADVVHALEFMEAPSAAQIAAWLRRSRRHVRRALAFLPNLGIRYVWDVRRKGYVLETGYVEAMMRIDAYARARKRAR